MKGLIREEGASDLTHPAPWFAGLLANWAPCDSPFFKVLFPSLGFGA